MYKDPNNAPTLPAYETSGQYAVWCCYCCRLHWHGAIPGHRRAHCTVPGSPYTTTGYVLDRAGPLTPALRKQYRDRRPERCRACGHQVSRLASERCMRCGKVLPAKRPGRVEVTA